MTRYEPELNASTPPDTKDTSTPIAFATDLLQLYTSGALPKDKARLLADSTVERQHYWGDRNPSGSFRARGSSGQTGSGSFYANANEIAIVTPRAQADRSSDPVRKRQNGAAQLTKSPSRSD